MPFEAGTRLGPYEIVAPLGAGAMGEVYRARDTRLDRTVAIKVLTGALAADSESRRRFEHEARAIAALNDPHICTIHDVGRHGDLDYLVLEYLEGETLEDRLKRSPRLPLTEALTIAIQIGDALGRAHRAGIVHHDLKPGNVMLVGGSRPASAPHAKLLDFGLAARTAHPQAPSASLAETMGPSQVATQPPTPASTVGGTVPYMAPELLNGDEGDRGADIFAFGCVLYEMLAGQRAFTGATTLTVMAAIMHSEPPSVAALESAQPLLDHVVRRCLEKDRERRWQSISDVTGELRWIVDHPVAPPQASARQSAPSLMWRVAIAAGLVLATAVGAAGVLVLRGSVAGPSLPPLRFEISTPPTDEPSIALSPDGTQIAFIANQDRVPLLWVRSLDASDSRALAGTEDARLPFWSPDGRTIGFFADGKLKRVDVAGGKPLVVADAPNARGGAWNADGVILFAPGVSASIRRVSASGGPVESVTQTNASSGPSHRLPQFLPDGNRFLFSSSLGTDTNGVYLGSLDKRPPVRLLPDDAAGQFAPPDRLLVLRQGALQAYRFDAAAGTVQGEPVVIAQDFADVSTSDTGVLAYRAGSAQRRQLVWVNRQGAVLRAIGEPEANALAAPELSPDEQSVVVFLHPPKVGANDSGDNDIWVIELARGLARPVTAGPPADAQPLWDPDGQHVVFNSSRTGVAGPKRQAVIGGTAEALFPKGENGAAVSWTRDRRYILLRRNGAQSGSDLVAVTTEGEPRELIVTQAPADQTEGQFSPDGKWVAFVSDESGRSEVFVQSFPEGRARTQVSTAGGTQVRWSGDGREIFYVAPDGKMTAVSIAFGAASPVVKAPVPLFQTHLATGTNVLGLKPMYAVSRDGRFLLDTVVDSPSAPIVVMVNWMTKQAK